MNDILGSRWSICLDAFLSRREFGLGAALVALTGGLDVGAKKKKKKKPSGTCIEIAQACSGSGCCLGLDCKPIFNSGPTTTVGCRSAGDCRFAADCCRGTYCGGGECLTCKGEGEDCFAGQCCPGSFCLILVPPGPGRCIRSD